MSKPGAFGVDDTQWNLGSQQQQLLYSTKRPIDLPTVPNVQVGAKSPGAFYTRGGLAPEDINVQSETMQPQQVLPPVIPAKAS